MTKLSIVIPVFNESSLIHELTSRVRINAMKITDDFEILIVDDGSKDTTWDEVKKEAESEKRLKGIKFSRNFGHHYAITAGLHQSRGDWVVVMDGDLQDRPEVIPELYDKAVEGFEIVFVSRQNRPEKLYYKIAQKLFYILLRFLSGMEFDSKQANFSIISRKVVEAFKIFPENARFYGSTIKWLGFTQSQIFADHGTRFSGRPSYTFRKRVKLASDIILSFSERPLKFAINLGILISLISFGMTTFSLYKFISTGYLISNWASLISIILFLAGVILVVLGILGIYLSKIFVEVKRRPLYIKSEDINL